jgi:hypothetical protein
MPRSRISGGAFRSFAAKARIGMNTTDHPTSYDPIIRTIHWLTLALIAAVFAAAWTPIRVSPANGTSRCCSFIAR